jgi:hypothetical protein
VHIITYVSISCIDDDEKIPSAVLGVEFCQGRLALRAQVEPARRVSDVTCVVIAVRLFIVLDIPTSLTYAVCLLCCRLESTLLVRFSFESLI